MLRKMRAIPDSQAPYIAGRLLLEKCTDLLNLGPAAGGVEKQVAQLAAVGLDVDSAFGDSRIALEDEDLVLGPALLLDGLHGGRR